MTHNRATIYSNGIADFQRVFQVAGDSPTRISIPVRQEHLGDILASLTVSGSVKIVSPPSFQPANQDDGNIVINNNQVIVSLVKELAGANVSVVVGTKMFEGQLAGLQSQQVATEGQPVDEISLVLLVDSEIKRFSMREIQSLKFLDPVVQSEIEKSLNRSLRETKPNSTFVELELSTSKKKSSAFVQYTIPAAAWKISYRILLNQADQVEFHGHAIVDNNTDEDWRDFIVSVVMGQPITFSTDLADSKTPGRSHVNIVQDSAIGSVEVEQTVAMAVPAETADGFFGAHAQEAPVMRKMARRDMAGEASARIDTAEVAETGDFCIYESAGPISIDAHRSAVIPVFQTTLDESSAVLHYKESNHVERPFRAIRFKNTTEHSLSRGVCTVYDSSTFAGSCILPATKPDDKCLLPHALETGVRIRKEQGRHKTRRVGIKISNGVVYDSHHSRIQTRYLINSSRDESLPLVLDHDWHLGLESEFDCHLLRDNAEPIELEIERLKNGIRFEFQLLERDVITVTIVESKVVRSRVQLIGDRKGEDGFRIRWLCDNIVETDMPLSEDPKLRECIEIHKRLMEMNDQVSHGEQEIGRHEKRQVRLRSNIQTGGGEQQNLRWQNDLARAEDAIVQLEDEHLPQLNIEREALRKQLDLALRSLIIEWNE